MSERLTLSDFEVSGTITTGVEVYCPDCDDWFEDWTSRERYPTVQQLVDVCTQHATECPRHDDLASSRDESPT